MGEIRPQRQGIALPGAVAPHSQWKCQHAHHHTIPGQRHHNWAFVSEFKSLTHHSLQSQHAGCMPLPASPPPMPGIQLPLAGAPPSWRCTAWAPLSFSPLLQPEHMPGRLVTDGNRQGNRGHSIPVPKSNWAAELPAICAWDKGSKLVERWKRRVQ